MRQNKTRLHFQDITFVKYENYIKLYLYKYLSAKIPIDEFIKLGKKFDVTYYNVENGDIVFIGNANEEALKERFLFLLEKYLPFKNEINARDAYFISEPLGIPLFGILGFGIVDRGTNIIEIRPLTSCPFDCIHCSLAEGKSNKRKRDFFVEVEYMVKYVNQFIEPKENKIIAFINPQGETLMYDKLKDLIYGLKQNPKIRKVMIATRLPFWTKEYFDELINAGLDQVQLSLDTLDEKKYHWWLGYKYNINRILKFIDYYHDKVEIMLTPVWIPNVNDEDMFKLLELAKKYRLGFGIQKYLRHKFGKKLKEASWKEFDEFLKRLYEKVNYTGTHMFENFIKDYKPKEVFKINEILEVELKLPGRLMNELIGVARGRALTVVNKKKKPIKLPTREKVKIVRLNDNIAMGVLL